MNFNLTWSSSNNRFEGSNSETLHHNGTTWVFNSDKDGIYHCTASYLGSPVGAHVDPGSSSIDWSCSASITASAGGAGDPHIKPILGKPYTI